MSISEAPIANNKYGEHTFVTASGLDALINRITAIRGSLKDADAATAQKLDDVITDISALETGLNQNSAADAERLARIEALEQNFAELALAYQQLAEHVKELHTAVISTTAELMTASAKGGDIRLAAPITLEPEVETVVLSGTTVLDLNGEMLSGSVSPSWETDGDIIHVAGGNVTIMNGSISDTHEWDGKSQPAGTIFVTDGAQVTMDNLDVTGVYPLWVRGNDSVVTIKSGTYKATVSQAIYVQGQSKIVIEGGTYEAPMYGTKNYCLNVKDSEYIKTKPATDYIEVKGGKFIGFNPAMNSENPITSFVADGYISEETSDGVWEVREMTVAEKVCAGGDVVVTEDIAMEPEQTLEITSDANIDLNGKTISGSVSPSWETCGDLLRISGGNVTVANGTITDEHEWDGKSQPAGTVYITNGANVVLDNVNVSGVYPVWVHGDGIGVTIKSGSYKATVSQAIYVQGQSKITIEGGTFEAPNWGSKNYCLNVKDSEYIKTKPATDYIEVRGGRFINFNPAMNSENPITSFVADGYESVEVEPSVWEVRPIAQ